MRTIMIRSVLLLALAPLLAVAGCATVSRTPTQTMEIASIPAGAEVSINDAIYGTTPLSPRLRRDGHYVVRMELEGYEPQEIALDRTTAWGTWLFGNIAVLSVAAPLGWIVDATSGALYEHSPDPMLVLLDRPDGTAPDETARPGAPDPAVAAKTEELAPAAAEQRSPAPGDSIRLTVGEVSSIFEFRGWRADTLLVRTDDGLRRVAVAQVDAVHVGTRESRGSKILNGGLLGLALGAGTGALFGAIFTCSGSGDWLCHPDPNFPVQAAVTFGGVLGVTGAALGAVSRRGWRWRPVNTTELTVGVAPSSGAVGVGLTWHP